MQSSVELMLRDYITELEVLLRDANAKRGGDYDDGRKMGLYESLSLLVDTCRNFGIPLNELGHPNLNPDDFLKEWGDK